MAAKLLFERNGICATTVEMVAADAGLTLGVPIAFSDHGRLRQAVAFTAMSGDPDGRLPG